MKYYILYESESDYELNVVRFELAEDVTCFIEKKLNEYGYRLTDFKVVHGKELSMQAVRAPTKVLITN